MYSALSDEDLLKLLFDFVQHNSPIKPELEKEARSRSGLWTVIEPLLDLTDEEFLD